MTEEQHEALDGGDLDEQERKADRQKVEGDAPSREIGGRGSAARGRATQRQQDQDEASSAAWISVAASTR